MRAPERRDAAVDEPTTPLPLMLIDWTRRSHRSGQTFSTSSNILSIAAIAMPTDLFKFLNSLSSVIPILVMSDDKLSIASREEVVIVVT